MNKYNIEGSSNQLRLEICALQKDTATIQDCNHELMKFNSDDSWAGFMVAILFVFVFLSGYWLGKTT